MPLLLLAAAGVGAYLLMSSKGGGSVASAQQAATQTANQQYAPGDSTSGTPDPNATYLGEVDGGTVNGFYDPLSGRNY